MASRSKSRLLRLTITSTAVVGGTYIGLTYLEKKYPPLSPESSSTVALRTPHNQKTQYCTDVHVYFARVPVSLLQRAVAAQSDKNKITTQELQEAWARTVIGGRILRTEGSLAGLSTNRSFTSGDIGDTAERFSPDAKTGSPRKLLNGLMVVERPPDQNGLLISWKMADEPRQFFEKIARWGYPWRLMSGGRHEISVSEPYEGEGEEKVNGPFVDVRFSAAHDYEIVPEEGGLQNQKMIPGWTGVLHRGFARLILDDAIRELKRQTAERP